MQDHRAEAAIARIERALDRIERSVGGNEDAAGELARLRSAHELLRSRVEGAIGEIDQMLNGSGEGAR
jgi:hypothetical protein